MPKQPDDTPDVLRPFLFHGVNLSWKEGGAEATGDCPWCGKEGKFSVNLSTGLWRCFGCNEGIEKDKVIKGGNLSFFLTNLWEKGYAATPPGDYAKLAAERRLLYPDTLVRWNLAKSPTTGDWILPGYDIGGKLTSLYRYVRANGRTIWMPTPTLGHHLLGINLFVRDDSHELIYLCEGLWDSTPLWEILGCSREEEGTYKQTSNREASLLATENVVGIASNLAFNEAWLPLFKNQIVVLMCQNDHEKRMCKKCRKSYSKLTHERCPSCTATEVTELIIPPASYAGMERIAKLLHNVAADIHYLYWGDDGYDPKLPSGYDTRDVLTR